MFNHLDTSNGVERRFDFKLMASSEAHCSKEIGEGMPITTPSTGLGALKFANNLLKALKTHKFQSDANFGRYCAQWDTSVASMLGGTAIRKSTVTCSPKAAVNLRGHRIKADHVQ
eukprot:5368074-Amphidinium_carterae.1